MMNRSEAPKQTPHTYADGMDFRVQVNTNVAAAKARQQAADETAALRNRRSNEAARQRSLAVIQDTGPRHTNNLVGLNELRGGRPVRESNRRTLMFGALVGATAISALILNPFSGKGEDRPADKQDNVAVVDIDNEAPVTTIVQPGQTAWGIAREIAGNDEDPRSVLDQMVDLNGNLGSIDQGDVLDMTGIIQGE